MKKVLMVATVPSMIGQFNMNNIQILQELGYEVHVACDFNDRSVWTDERVEKFKAQLEENDVKFFQVDFSRSPLKVWKHRKSYVQLKKLLEKNEYEFIHCHTPIASVICRLVAHKMKVKCIYTAHGFHFFKGAPLKNWVIYYPIEQFLSRWTDVLITINKEDYQRAKGKMRAKEVVLIHGVGVDTKRFAECNVNREEKRQVLGFSQNDLVLISVGEVNDNKNHGVIIEAIAKLCNEKIKYIICGQGNLKEERAKRIKELGLENQVKLIGFQSDVKSYLQISDVFVFPSKREGLGLAAIEAMACGLPLITSNIHGINDYSIDGVTGCKCNRDNVNEYKGAIEKMHYDEVFRRKCGEYNREHAELYDVVKTNEIMRKVYEDMF